ncbi:MAG: hypothetical protein DRM97_08415, partial [Thermoprotei archaeon]
VTGPIHDGQNIYLELDVDYEPAVSYARLPLTIAYKGDEVQGVHQVEVPVTFKGAPLIRAYAEEKSIVPGAVNKILITISNEGDGVARDVEIRIEPRGFAAVIGESVKTISMMEPGESIKYEILLSVEEEVDRYVQVDVRITYRDQHDRTFTDTYTFGFAIHTAPRPYIVLVPKGTKLEPGKVNTIELQVTNVGDVEAREIVIQFTSRDPEITVLGSNFIMIDSLSPGEDILLVIKAEVSSSAKGPLEIVATIAYVDPNNVSYRETRNIGFYARSPPRPIVKVEPLNTTIVTGVVSEVTLKVVNIGQEVAKRIMIDLLPSQGILVIGSGRVYVEELPPGQEILLRINVTTSERTLAQTYIEVRFSYEDDRGRRFEDYTRIGLNAEPSSEPCVVAELLDEVLKPSSTNEVKVKIVNVGRSIARNVTIVLVSYAEQATVLGSGMRIIEKLNYMESVTLEYSVYVQPKVYGTIQLYLTITFEDPSGFTHRKIVPIGFKVKGEGRLAISKVMLRPPTIYPGDRPVYMTLYITNIGDYIGEDVELHLKAKDNIIAPLYKGADVVKIPLIPIGEVVEATFMLSISEDASPGHYELELEVRGEHVVNETLHVPLTIHEPARFNISLISASPAPRPGSKGIKLRLYIVNTSNVTAEEVVVELISPLLVGSTTSLIGNMPPEYGTIVVFEVDVDEHALVGRLPVDINVVWRQDERLLSDAYTIYLNIEKPEQYTMYLVGLLIALAIITGLLIKRRFGRKL